MIAAELRNRLRAAALEAGRRAFAPYSHFRVGAAVACGDQVFAGCNVENASYGLTICAERAATAAAVAAGRTTIDAAYVVCLDAPSGSPPEARMPCGACRQVLREFTRDDTPIIIEGAGEWTMGELLPLPFTIPGSRLAGARPGESPAQAASPAEAGTDPNSGESTRRNPM